MPMVVFGYGSTYVAGIGHGLGDNGAISIWIPLFSAFSSCFYHQPDRAARCSIRREAV
jgi:hypothetical protein